MNSPLPIIDRLTRADLPGVRAIEQTLAAPWTFAQLEEELTIGHGWQLVAKTDGGQVLGYLFASLVLDEAEIRKIAVAVNSRRLGIGQLLLSAAFSHLLRRQIRSCFLELRASNTPALALYLKNGFHIAGRRKNYYTRPAEDALVLIKTLTIS